MFYKLAHKIGLSIAFLAMLSVLLVSTAQASFAATMDPCHGPSAKEAANLSVDQVEHCAENTDSQSSSDQGHKNVDNCCVSHCCVVNISFSTDYTHAFSLLKEKVVSVYEPALSADFLFGIFRPPRLFV